MFGNNPIRPAVHDPNWLSVESVFYTIQGEGPYSGRAALFIRMAGCNLACWFCDTSFETKANSLEPVSQIVDDILKRFTPSQRRFVVLTGGEPLRQNISELVFQLVAAGTELVQIETAGTLWNHSELVPLFENGTLDIVCSPKTPRVAGWIAANCRHWKYIISAGTTSAEDGLPIRGTALATMNKEVVLYRPTMRLGPGRLNTIWVSPCDEYSEDKNLGNVNACKDAVLQYGYRLSLQVHKLIGVE